MNLNLHVMSVPPEEDRYVREESLGPCVSHLRSSLSLLLICLFNWVIEDGQSLPYAQQTQLVTEM